MALGNRFDAVVFDLDGTLIDTAPDLAAALNHTLALHGLPTLALDEVRPTIGDGARAMLERGLARAGVRLEAEALAPLVAEFLAFYRAHIADRSRPFPGLEAELDRLAASGLALAVCTNKLVAYSELLLERLGLIDRFRAVLGGDSLAVRKPDPGHVLGTLARLGVAPARAVMVGDSANDLAAGRGAGLPVVLVSFGYTPVPAADLGADALIDGFDELGAALARLS